MGPGFGSRRGQFHHDADHAGRRVQPRILLLVNDGGAVAHQVGHWPPGIAIPFAADMFTALMLSVTLILTVVSIWFAQASRAANSATSHRWC